MSQTVNLGHVVGPGVPNGGTAGQVLKKNSGTNFDTSWSDNNATTVPMSGSDSTSIKNAMSKILPVITGTTNNSGYAIAAGEYFEANGGLYQATASIPVDNAWSSSATALTDHGAVNVLNSNITKLRSNENFTNDILSDALLIDGTTVFVGAGSEYTGTVPDSEYKYGYFIAIKRASGLYSVIAVSRDGNMASNAYNNATWKGWKKVASIPDSLIMSAGTQHTITFEASCAGMMIINGNNDNLNVIVPFYCTSSNLRMSVGAVTSALTLSKSSFVLTIDNSDTSHGYEVSFIMNRGVAPTTYT